MIFWIYFTGAIRSKSSTIPFLCTLKTYNGDSVLLYPKLKYIT